MGRPKTSARRLLIVEDDESVADGYRKVLEEHDEIEVQEVADASAALEKIEKWSPEVVLLDLMMLYGDAFELLEGRSDPNEIDTGLRLLRHLRTQAGHLKGQPPLVIVATARSSFAVEEVLAELLGEDDAVFYKPFDTFELEERILRALGLSTHLEDTDTKEATEDRGQS